MYKISPEQMVQIKAVVGNGHEAQEAIFNALDFDPYEYEGGCDSDVVWGYDSVVMERERYESERKERLENPADYGICETEERSEEIKAGAVLTQKEERSLNENIFDHDHTFMVISTFSNGTDEIIAVTVQQIWGQLGIHVINFIGFFANDADAQKAIEQADYVTFEET
ncbi:hypothetical protein [Candidatus Puniceispirillum marinum]|uniref:Uncharacterized protein n=1 Tax=Puniceispirillum marinum (strain IMCC1322) TaxID=488538 RepID=D5BPE3_PUNMI|nr:hypothetical protein [Candidatus Puniceispirillum marinum]ADE38425.1 hypothetical protein SAR116_0182 [Candidatus Puniceispirillum marinum IMCC1322]